MKVPLMRRVWEPWVLPGGDWTIWDCARENTGRLLGKHHFEARLEHWYHGLYPVYRNRRASTLEELERKANKLLNTKNDDDDWSWHVNNIRVYIDWEFNDIWE